MSATKFFVPEADSPSDGAILYREILEYLVSNGFCVTQDIIRRIEYTQKAQHQTAEVGYAASANGELVMAIFALSSGSYAICTTHRGWDMTRTTIFTGFDGDDLVNTVQYFEP